MIFWRASCHIKGSGFRFLPLQVKFSFYEINQNLADADRVDSGQLRAGAMVIPAFFAFKRNCGVAPQIKRIITDYKERKIANTI
jgi:hypothetical protein